MIPGFDFDSFNDKQKTVIKKAEDVLKKFPWFTNVCLDNLPSECELINEHAVEIAVKTLVQDTTYFDGPIELAF